jgi:hypothetical protein
MEIAAVLSHSPLATARDELQSCSGARSPLHLRGGAAGCGRSNDARSVGPQRATTEGSRWGWRALPPFAALDGHDGGPLPGRSPVDRSAVDTPELVAVGDPLDAHRPLYDACELLACHGVPPRPGSAGCSRSGSPPRSATSRASPRTSLRTTHTHFGGRPKRRAGAARRAVRRRGAAERCGRVGVGAARAFRGRRP